MMFTNLHLWPGERVRFRAYGHGRRGGWVDLDDAQVTTDDPAVAAKMAEVFAALAASFVMDGPDAPISESELRALAGDR